MRFRPVRDARVYPSYQQSRFFHIKATSIVVIPRKPPQIKDELRHEVPS